ncbi:MAG TPA: hypothetical protein ENI61_00880, partial [Ignavibacteria bacterium]|nr:hypothetical protein [Ignavibacteria bacterium]
MLKISKISILLLIIATFSVTSNAQVNPVILKSQAISEMQTGLYGEAIALLNKYIAARPQNADG